MFKTLFGVVVILGDAVVGITATYVYRSEHGHLDPRQLGLFGGVALVSILVIWYLVASERKKSRASAPVQSVRRPYSGIRQ